MCTSSISSNPKVDVFLNFRGEVRRGFLSHLSNAFVQQNIRCFMNKEEEEKKERTERRKQVPPKVLGAISEAEVAVVVLSKNYASSSWCLDELVKITETKSIKVVPVYYEVDISDVQYQKGSFGEDFQRHGQVESPDTMERWRKALTKLAGSKPDFSAQLTKDDSKLTREITRHVSGLLSRSRLHKGLLPGKACGVKFTTRKTSESRRVSDSDKLIAIQSGKSYSYIPITMDRQTDKFISETLKLESTSEVRVIGISGVAGIGKTTIARHLYQKLSLTFQDHWFFESGGDILNQCSGTQGISKPSATKHISQSSRKFRDQGCDLPASSGSQEELPSPKSLKRKATVCSDLGSDDNKRTTFWHQRVLVIVDNVETRTQLEEIMKYVNRLGPGSRVIIVTTQDKSLLSKCGVAHVYEVDSLKYDDALELFSECAFKMQYPPATFEQLSVRAVNLTGCLPLGLKLLGSFLSGRTKEDWEYELQRLGAEQDKANALLLDN